MPGNPSGKSRSLPAAPLERLHKVLARAGIASRRQCEQIIAGGQVTVDDRTGRVRREPAGREGLSLCHGREVTGEAREGARG